VVGYKPSYDRVSKAGVLPLAPSVDTVGLFTPEVRGADIVAPFLCNDWQPLPTPKALPVLGVPEGPYLERATAAGQSHFRAVCETLKMAGFEVKPVPVMADFEVIEAHHKLLVAAEAAQVHAAWFSEYRALYHPKTAALIEQGQGVTAVALEKALAGREKLRRELMEVMDMTGIDLWISPPARGAAPLGLESTGDPIMNLPWTHAGLPTMTLPAGFNGDGLPLGLQLAGAWYGDEAMMAAAARLEPVLQYH
jgi:Asp-tRNA(Asn)/Glu-tRNA(Gln) amidotransferase A subunit family amidase